MKLKKGDVLYLNPDKVSEIYLDDDFYMLDKPIEVIEASDSILTIRWITGSGWIWNQINESVDQQDWRYLFILEKEYLRNKKIYEILE